MSHEYLDNVLPIPYFTKACAPTIQLGLGPGAMTRGSGGIKEEHTHRHIYRNARVGWALCTLMDPWKLSVFIVSITVGKSWLVSEGVLCS